MAQARVLEVTAQARPQALHGPNARQQGQAPWAERRAHRHQAGPTAAHVGLLHLKVERARLGHEALELRGGCATREFRNGLLTGPGVGVQVEPFRGRPGMPRENRQGREGDNIREAQARSREQVLKDPRHGDDRGAGIDPLAAGLALVDLSAGLGVSLEHRDLHTLAGEVHGSREPTHAGPNNEHRTRAHAGVWAVLSCPMSRRIRNRMKADSEK